MPRALLIYVAKLDGIFGYGLTAYGHTEDEAMRAMRRAYAREAKSYGSTTPFARNWEAFGGWVEAVEVGKAYRDGSDSPM